MGDPASEQHLQAACARLESASNLCARAASFPPCRTSVGERWRRDVCSAGCARSPLASAPPTSTTAARPTPLPTTAATRSGCPPGATASSSAAAGPSQARRCGGVAGGGEARRASALPQPGRQGLGARGRSPRRLASLPQEDLNPRSPPPHGVLVRAQAQEGEAWAPLDEQEEVLVRALQYGSWDDVIDSGGRWQRRAALLLSGHPGLCAPMVAASAYTAGSTSLVDLSSAQPSVQD